MTVPADETPDTSIMIAEVIEEMNVLAGSIRASQREAAARIDPTLQAFGLRILRLLARSGPTHAGAVANLLAVDKSVISRHTKPLCELGLVETQPDPSDGRAHYLAITPLAIAKLEELRAGDTAIVHRRLSSWSVSDLHELARLLAQLNTP
ncbi:MarR family winged helix-turn-helix transcriptional regulator [Cryobacterium roopkundense]|uniref:DNA-binding MarR family transcriptional regulator n=1 Tax=Cryobacterium roopkundense TaxID=1001240 RepID=A0A7W9E5R5_9MICO|nr:MarR family winged helix-turn-helix transcriptional regulator [Cryobacterium roopkundense]MBB5642684.1 DNA-binding MarR family transcriptional regulator [Cryobacterium roopkundense]